MQNQTFPGGPSWRSGGFLRAFSLALAIALLGGGNSANADSEQQRESAAATKSARAPRQVLGVAPAKLTLPVGSTATATVANPSGEVRVRSSHPGVVGASYSAGTIQLTGFKAGKATLSVSDARTTKTLSVTVSPRPTSATPTAGAARYTLLAWNDLGMHCVDGKDYSVFSILPPYNNLHAQLVNASTGRQVSSGVTLTYESVADASGSINTISSTKTNFWTHVKSLFGVDAAPDLGLTGKPTASLTPAGMNYNATQGWFEAEGIPITPYDDVKRKNFYPLVRVVARDGAGKVLASTQTVLPVSDEMTCKGCHSSTASGNSAQTAARPPVSGWAFDPDDEKDWKWNVLRLHDDSRKDDGALRNALAQLNYDARGLAATAAGGKPVLCAACHASNALPGTGIAGISALTAALHTQHAEVVDPVRLVKLDAIDNRGACYNCHPGSETKCLRGAMGNAVDAVGNATMGCQSCHGGMKAVGEPTRVGWLDQPTCQSCHYDGKRETTALDSVGKLRQPTDRRFATNRNTPQTNLTDHQFSLFRFSIGHGKLQCEACHGSTHAEYPSSHDNDNLQSIALQGYAGTLRECQTCHVKVPLTTAGGPHGMHTIGATWVDKHGDRVEQGGADDCRTCHGADLRGSPLAAMAVARSFRVEDGRTRAYAKGDKVGCYDCHDGPNGD